MNKEEIEQEDEEDEEEDLNTRDTVCLGRDRDKLLKES